MQQVWDFLTKGGIVMVPLLFCSIGLLAIVIEKMISLRRGKIIAPELVAVLESMRGRADINMALAACERIGGPLARMAGLTLANTSRSREEVKESLFDQGRQEMHQLEKGLPILETIAAVAPLLGLLGTVIGILKVFDVISVMGVGQAAALSGGISEALITTIFGLSIGIPALVAHNYFGSKAEAQILEIEKYLNILLGRLAEFSTGTEH